MCLSVRVDVSPEGVKIVTFLAYLSFDITEASAQKSLQRQKGNIKVSHCERAVYRPKSDQHILRLSYTPGSLDAWCMTEKENSEVEVLHEYFTGVAR